MRLVFLRPVCFRHENPKFPPKKFLASELLSARVKELEDETCATKALHFRRKSRSATFPQRCSCPRRRSSNEVMIYKMEQFLKNCHFFQNTFCMVNHKIEFFLRTSKKYGKSEFVSMYSDRIHLKWRRDFASQYLLSLPRLHMPSWCGILLF